MHHWCKGRWGRTERPGQEYFHSVQPQTEAVFHDLMHADHVGTQKQTRLLLGGT